MTSAPDEVWLLRGDTSLPRGLDRSGGSLTVRRFQQPALDSVGRAFYSSPGFIPSEHETRLLLLLVFRLLLLPAARSECRVLA